MIGTKLASIAVSVVLSLFLFIENTQAGEPSLFDLAVRNRAVHQPVAEALASNPAIAEKARVQATLARWEAAKKKDWWKNQKSKSATKKQAPIAKADAIEAARKNQSKKRNSPFFTGWVELESKGEKLCYSWKNVDGLPQSVCRPKHEAKVNQIQIGAERVVCMQFRVGDSNRIRVNRPCARAFLDMARQMDQFAQIKRSEANSKYKAKTAKVRELELKDLANGV